MVAAHDIAPDILDGNCPPTALWLRSESIQFLWSRRTDFDTFSRLKNQSSPISGPTALLAGRKNRIIEC
jgi:hypothetical protein